MERLEYFKKAVVIEGKHSKYVDALWKQNNVEESYFNRLLDIYCIAPFIGLKAGKNVDIDHSEDGKRTIQADQLYKADKILDIAIKTILLLSDKETLSEAERINRAFRGPKTKEEFDENVKLFDGYVRGGIEVLYDKLIMRQGEVTDYTNTKIANIIALYDEPILVGSKLSDELLDDEL